MKVGRYLYMAAVVAGLAVSWSLWHPVTAATPPNAQRFVVDPFYPKPLPDNWVTGEIGGTCIDAKDHVFAVTRGFQTGGSCRRKEWAAPIPQPVRSQVSA